MLLGAQRLDLFLAVVIALILVSTLIPYMHGMRILCILLLCFVFIGVTTVIQNTSSCCCKVALLRLN